MKKINVITIDGPSASGKGALARGIANKFDFNILDSGVLYRLYAYLSKMSFSPDEIANQIEGYVEFKKNKEKLLVSYKSTDVTSELRSEIIAKSASEHSSKKEVREALFNIQRNFYDGNGIDYINDDLGFDLRRYFDRSGIDLESQLRRGLSDLQSDFLKLDNKDFDPLKKLIKDLMSFTKLFKTSVDPSEQVLQIPYLTEGRLEELTLVVGRETPDNDNNEGNVTSLRLYVDLSNLGPTMIGFQIVNDRLDITFRNEDFRVIEFLQSRQSQITEEMSGVSDFRVIKVRVVQSKVEAPDPLFLDEAVKPQRIDMSV